MRARFVFALALVFVVACEGGPATYDRAAMLRETGEHVILPGYEAVAADAASLSVATASFCEAPDASRLSDARAAWRVVFLSWQRTTSYQFGPTRELNLGPEMAFWPTRPMTIEANLARPDAITPAWIDSLGAGGKGLHAIEYLMFASDEATTLAALSDARRCAYLAALADHVARTSAEIVDAWRPEGGDHLGVLATAGDDANDVYPSQLGAASTMATQVLFQLRFLKLNELGIPLGNVDGLPQPGSIECLYAQCSVEAMRASLEGTRALWSEAPHSFDGWLRTRAPELADTILAHFDAAIAAVSTLPEPFGPYVSGDDHAAGDATYERIRTLERAIGVDATTTLGVLVMFTDNDGD